MKLNSTVACCVLAAICEGIDLQAAGVAAPGISSEFHPLADQLGTFFSASTVGLLLGAVFGGRLSDSIGRKKVLVSSIAVFGLLSLLTCFAWSIESLAWARFLTGLGLGGALPNLLALTNESSGAARRRANVALVYAGNPIGGVIASALLMLIDVQHWRWVFVLGGVAPLIIAAIMQLAMPGPGSVSSTVRQRRADSFAIFGSGFLLSTMLLWISFALGLMTLYLLLSWLPTLLSANGLPKTQVGIAQVAFNLGGAMAALGIGQLLEGRWRMPSVLVVLAAVPGLIVLLAKFDSQRVEPIVAVVFGLGCAVLAAQAFLYSEAPTRYTSSIRGIGVGAAVAAGRLGSIGGPKLGGILKSAGHTSSQLLTDIIPLVITGSIVASILLFYRPRANAN